MPSTKKIAILQSNYIPWKGYFDLLNSVDEFIIYDNVQYTKNDWRNRNLIKTQSGLLWLTIPVRQNSLAQAINETQVLSGHWAKKHYKSIEQNYSKAKFFEQYKNIIKDLYDQCQDEKFLSDINLKFLNTINSILDINTHIRNQNEFALEDGQTKRLVSICKECKADVYLSGPAAQNYLDEKIFSDNNTTVEWMDYGGYPEYKQLFPPFEHGVSILDLIFNEGANATKFMKSFA